MGNIDRKGTMLNINMRLHYNPKKSCPYFYSAGCYTIFEIIIETREYPNFLTPRSVDGPPPLIPLIMITL